MATTSALLAVAAIGGLAAAGISAAGSVYAGQKSREAANIVAAQEEDQGREEFAASQREAFERSLEAKLTMSRQQAIAAASGGGSGADAPSIVRLQEKTAERGQYGEDSARYGGESRRRSSFRSADARRRTGENNFVGSLFTAGGTLTGGIGDFARMRA
jgi:hypothetical protein